MLHSYMGDCLLKTILVPNSYENKPQVFGMAHTYITLE